MIAARRARQKRRILIVGMRAGVEHAGRRLQALQQLHETRRAGVVDRAHLRVGSHKQQRRHIRRARPDIGSCSSGTSYLGKAARGSPGTSFSAFSKYSLRSTASGSARPLSFQNA